VPLGERRVARDRRFGRSLGWKLAMSQSSTPNPVDPSTKSGKKRDTDQLKDRSAGVAEAVATPPGGSAALDTHDFPATGGKSLIGYRFDDFELLEELGRGGMGIVYKARQNSLDRVVAVKMLLAEHFQNPTVLARFLGEARAVAALDHPEIVKIYQIGQCAYGHYFAMEFIDGVSLEALISRAPLPIPVAVTWMIALARAMEHAHSKGIIHRDLKPANVMIRQQRRPVIMDFGIAKVAGKGASVTQQGMVVGTPSYMSPEQATEGNEPAGPASDVYSLGAILYAMLTSHAPYEEKTALNTIIKVISPDPPPPIRSYRPEVPAALDQLCMKALAKKPGDRYPSAKALADELQLFRKGELVAKPEPTTEWASVPSAYLVLQSTGKKIRLTALATVVGRSSECDLIVRSSAVSKRHCQILLEEDQVWVEDLDSSNGTLVNGNRIRRRQLTDGDKLEISGHVFVVRIPKKK
jgi:serine/threonine protein kinase